jgi:hypothetical protein
MSFRSGLIAQPVKELLTYMQPKDSIQRPQHARHSTYITFISSRPLPFNITYCINRNSSVTVVTTLQARSPRNHNAISNKGRRFPLPKASRPALKPNQVPIQKVAGILSPGGGGGGGTAARP